MSRAISMASLGVQCLSNRAIGMASLGVICFGVVLGGGRQFPDEAVRPFLIFKPVTDIVASQLPVSAEVLPYLQETETEFIIDGKKYELVEKRTPSEIIKTAPDVDKILDEAVEKLGITKRKAKKELYNEVIKNLKEVESIKDSVFNDDEEIIMILVATDDI